MKILYINTIKIWKAFTPDWRRAGNENMNYFEDEFSAFNDVDSLFLSPSLFFRKLNYGRPVSPMPSENKSINVSKHYDWIMTSALAPDMMDIAFAQLNIPNNVKRAIWLIDGWKKDWKDWLFLIKKYKINHIFCAYLENVNWLVNMKISSSWLPFGIPDKLFPDKKNKKSIDIVQLGRIRADFHNNLSNSNLKYKITKNFLIPLIKSTLSYREYLQILSKSKFTLCYPSGTELSEKVRVSTIGFSPTNMRWYEAMAAKSIPIGILPTDKEFSLLFPTDKVDIISTKPENIVREIESIKSIKNSVKKNYNYIISKHSYTKRVNEVLNTLTRFENVR